MKMILRNPRFWPELPPLWKRSFWWSESWKSYMQWSESWENWEIWIGSWSGLYKTSIM